MGIDQRKNEEAIFYSALELTSPEARAAYVKEACGDDKDLLDRVRALLMVDGIEDGFLEDPPTILDVPTVSEVATEVPGTVIGRYKLLEKIGEGGMAAVYMAEQEQPIRRKVALKIIKLGMDTRQVIARFEAERQALAMMDHPSIAKVLDAGATETGRPYFVMELVQGVCITEYCDRNSLSTQDRLGLFIQVCNAVQHAHQKGIIHRDLKPSNVMVTHHDGKPVPKVIDFGIAKATNQRLTEKTLFTRYAHVIGTPAYMSPEQAELSDLDIDTRSDIYSLGVLLYELLTGTTPFSEEELRKAGYVEMHRIIREQEPVKPSTRLTTLGDTLTDIARCRSSTPDLLRKAVRGDLDWIVMKSLEKDRSRRYETANALAVDVQHHLDNEPVLARGPSAAYRLQKFLRRHRVQVLVGLAFALLIAVVIVLSSIWNRDRLRLAQDEAFRDRGILSQAREHVAKLDYAAALEAIKPLLDSKHVGAEAQLLYAGILVDNRRSEEAMPLLDKLVNERVEIAGAAHSLLARILYESESPNAETLKQADDHRQKAQALVPGTAEAHFLQAMFAVTIKEQLDALDNALQLESDHYESRRLRAYMYYASRKYDKMERDAYVMTALWPRDPLGHSLRATALCELGRYQEAIVEYESALARTAKEDAQYPDLAAQRLETLLRMGSYEGAVSEGQRYLSQIRAKDLLPLQHPVFCALTALGDYDKALALFRQIIRPGPASRWEFERRCRGYISATLDAGRSWHPPDRAPTGAAFLPLVEGQEIYETLSAKARRISTSGFNPHWSPDGKKLAFSLGKRGSSGVAIYDLATKETELLIGAGRDPKWSPDGRYIAFARDRQFLRIPELINARYQKRLDHEVWLMKYDGTEPRRLAGGEWPSWSPDSKRVYYHSRLDQAVFSISIEERDAKPKWIAACSSRFPSVSPDNRYLAYLDNGRLKVKDLASQDVVAEWPVPFRAWGGPGWSPAGNELCLGPDAPAERIGLWIYRLGQSEPAKTLDGLVMNGSWALGGTKFVFDGSGIWVADLDPQVSTIEALGPGRTVDEHLREMVACYSRRIEADPQDALAYSNRASYHGHSREWTKVNIDRRRWLGLLRRGGSSNLQSGTPAGPSGFIFGTPTYIGGGATSPSVTADGRLLFVDSAWVPGPGGWDICVLTRATTQDPWGSPVGAAVNLGPTVNSSYGEGDPGISADGRTLYFDSARLGGCGGSDIWMTTRATRDSPWSPPVNLGAIINSPYAESHPELSAGGLSLYFGSNRPGGCGDEDLWVATRETNDGPWSQPRNLGPRVNSSARDNTPNISADGRTLFLSSDRPGGYGSPDLWVTTRATRDGPWSEPVNLGPAVNSPEWDVQPSISADGCVLYFSVSARPAGSGLWQVPIVPMVDLNGDGIVDAQDRAALTEHWGQPDSPCDIGPFPWGDGKVDAVDLEVLTRYSGQPVDDPTLLAHWPLDETDGLVVSNRAGGDEGVITGLPQWRPQGGRIGGALEFNGSTFITADFAFSPADGPFSVLVWIKGGAPGQTLVSQKGSVNWLTADAVRGALMTELSASGQTGGELSSQAIITDGNWHRVAFTWDGVKRRLYVDSVLVAQDTQNNLADISGKLLVGAGATMASGTFWTGLIDDVRIYNRVVKP